MKEASYSNTAVTMQIDMNPPGCPPCNSGSNFIVHLTCHNLCLMDFRPVLDYNGDNSCLPHRTSYGFHLFPEDLQTPDTIIEAVDEIMYTELGLYDELTVDQLLYMAQCIELGKTLLLDQGTSCYAMTAHVDIHNTYSFEDILPLDALVVQVKINEEDDTDSCCAVCLEGFAEGGDGEEVYKTRCSHLFHCGCIGKWLTRKGDCPICRFQLVFDSDRKIYSLGSLAESSTNV